MPLWRPAFPGSFREEREVETVITPTGERSSFQAWPFCSSVLPTELVERKKRIAEAQLRVTGSPCGHSQGPQGSAPGNELIEHLVNGLLMVRGRLELCAMFIQ